MAGRLSASLVALLVLTGCTKKPTPEPIAVGLVVARSGSAQEAARRVEQAVTLAVEEANRAEAPIAGRGVVVYPADDRGDPEALGPVAVRLVTVNRTVGLLGGTDAAQADRLARAAQPYDVSVITTAALGDAPAENVYSVAVGYPRQGKVLARLVAEEWKKSAVLVCLDARRPELAGLTAALAKELTRRAGVHIDTAEFKSEAELAGLAERARKAQVVVFAGRGADLAGLRRGVGESGAAPAFVFAGQEPAGGELGDGAFALTPFVPEGAAAVGQEFIRKYQDRYKEPPDARAALVYDACRILFEALNRATTVNPKAVQTALPDVKIDGTTDALSFGTDHEPRRPLFLVRIESGKPKMVKRFDADPR